MDESTRDVVILYGALQKQNDSEFTEKDIENLLFKDNDTFLDWVERKGLLYGGTLTYPPTPDDVKIARLRYEIDLLEGEIETCPATHHHTREI